MSFYPCSLWSPTTKTNKVDLVDAAHINTAQSEIVAIEAQLQKALDSDGTILSGSAFPSPSAGPSQLFYRTDLDILYIRNSTNTAWPAVSAVTNVQRFTSSGTFTAPTGITKVYISMCGGGGGGANNKGGGGGGGAYIIGFPFTVVPGNNYTVTIGAGGAGGADVGNTDGTIGGTTSFDSISVLGGSGGTANAGNGGAGGVGSINASASVSTFGQTAGSYKFTGGNGAKGQATDSGGAGGGTPFGLGAAGIDSAAGNAGPANTGGGGGGAGNTTGARPGGTGGSGFVIVAY